MEHLFSSPREQNHPDLMIDGWQEARQILHLYSQIMGKIKLKLHPAINHWWHVTLSISSSGWTTGLIPYKDDSFEIEANFVDHRMTIKRSDKGSRIFSLNQPTIKAFHDEVFQALHSLDIYVNIVEMPFDKTKVKSEIPFNRDKRPIKYNPEFAHRLWRAQLEADVAFQTFRGLFIGKSSPVQLFWHSFDLTVTFFSGRAAPVISGMDPVSKEAYSHEVISFGFWPGDDQTPEPSFYAYTYPEPKNLNLEMLKPHEAFWSLQKTGSLAILHYRDIQFATNPKATIMEFMGSVFKAGCKRCEWNDELSHLRTLH